MTKYDLNPFPSLGVSRIWGEKYIESACSKLPVLKWKNIVRLNKTLLSNVPECPGVYMFVRKSYLEKIFSIGSRYPLVVYIGKSKKLNNRLRAYIKDKKAVGAYRASERKVRDNIRVMFSEYGDELEVYFSACSPELLVQTEDILIQVFDPIFNFDQRLDESEFVSYENHISAEIVEGGDAYSDDESYSKVQELEINLGYVLGEPESAF